MQQVGYEVIVPEMPDTESPRIEAWVNHLKESIGATDSNTYFIGGSIGCQAILRYLETLDHSVGGAVFVSGWFDLENLDEEEQEIARPWIETPIDLMKVKSVLPKSTLIISDNDPFGAFELNKRKFSELGSKIVVMHNAGHISGDDGFTELPEAVSELEAL